MNIVFNISELFPPLANFHSHEKNTKKVICDMIWSIEAEVCNFQNWAIDTVIKDSYILRVVLVIIMEFHWFIGRVL